MKWNHIKSPDPAESTKQFYWRNHGMVVLQIDDPRMGWDIRELVKAFMVNHYGPMAGPLIQGEERAV